jgi:hypothetical protein
MEWYYWLAIFAGAYLIVSFGFACWSETNNPYRQFSMDMMYGFMFPLITAKWLYRLPGRFMSGDNSGIVRVMKDVWNG